MVLRSAWCATRTVLSERRERSTRVATVDLIGKRELLPGALVLDHAAPYAFCIAGRHHRVVVTTGLLDALSPDELHAVLAHEDAHLRQRHHAALLACRVLFTTLGPVFPAFRTAMTDVRLLVELSADDCARSRVGARALRGALATLAGLPAPPGALAASGGDVVARLHRLDHDAQTLAPAHRAGIALVIATAILVPLLLTAAPALTLTWEAICLSG